MNVTGKKGIAYFKAIASLALLIFLLIQIRFFVGNVLIADTSQQSMDSMFAMAGPLVLLFSFFANNSAFKTMLLTMKGVAILEINEQGIIDRRFLESYIPWSAIHAIDYKSGFNSYMIVKITPKIRNMSVSNDVKNLLETPDIYIRINSLNTKKSDIENEIAKYLNIEI